jgi:hypothetical protein
MHGRGGRPTPISIVCGIGSKALVSGERRWLRSTTRTSRRHARDRLAVGRSQTRRAAGRAIAASSRASATASTTISRFALMHIAPRS